MPMIRTNPGPQEVVSVYDMDSTNAIITDVMANQFSRYVTSHYEGELSSKTSRVSIPAHSQLPGESNMRGDSVIATLEPGSDHILQVFRASTDNVNSVFLMCRAEGSQTDNLISFDGYASSVALNADWLKTLAATTLTLNTTLYNTSPNSMQIEAKNPQSVGGLIYRSFASEVNMAGYLNLEMWWYFPVSGQFTVMIRDANNNEATYTFNDGGILNQWQMIDASFLLFDNVGTVDLSRITQIGFYCDIIQTANYLVDSISLEGNIGLSLETSMQLYDFGTTADPSSLADGTALTFDNGQTEITFEMKSYDAVRKAKKFQYGVMDNSKKLTIGNYYGVLIKAPTENLKNHYNGTDFQRYSSGKMYVVDATSGVMTDTTNSLGFIINYFGESSIAQIQIYGGGSDKGIAGYVFMMAFDATTHEDLHFYGQYEFAGQQQLLNLEFANDAAFNQIFSPDGAYFHMNYQGHPDNGTLEVEFDITWKYNEIARYN